MISTSISISISSSISSSSGGGKSTIIDLLSKFYIVDKGEVLVDGVDISHYNTSQLRNIIGIVTQESILFHDSIRNNISFGDGSIDEEKIIESRKMDKLYRL